ncbi:MAG: SBBP repeat-containing protein [Bacteroidales bacterium]|nr:SBBP repeat-containing protein [Bacteroidales bacterium]
MNNKKRENSMSNIAKFQKISVKKILFTILIFCIFSTFLFAQTPNWEWAIQAGGEESDKITAITVDDYGNSYVTGKIKGSATLGTFTLSSAGENNIFVAKIDAKGNWLWVTQTGDNDYINVSGIAIDDTGNCYITGGFLRTANFGSHSITAHSSKKGDFDKVDAFVAKIDNNGNWKWAKKAGGSGSDEGYGISLDSFGNIYIIGTYYYTSAFGSYSISSSNDKWQTFVAMMNKDGVWQWVSKIDGQKWGRSSGLSIATDKLGNSYVTGYFSSNTSLETIIKFDSYPLELTGKCEVFVAKINMNGIWQWASKAVSMGEGFGKAISIDDFGNTYLTGYFKGKITFGNDSYISEKRYDIFAAKIDANGNWIWSFCSSGEKDNRGSAITIDKAGNCYITGNNNNKVFVQKINTQGNLHGAIEGGSCYVKGTAIEIDNLENIYLTGTYYNDTATFGSHSITNNGEDDIFVAKLTKDYFASIIAPEPIKDDYVDNSINEKLKQQEIKQISETPPYKNNIFYDGFVNNDNNWPIGKIESKIIIIENGKLLLSNLNEEKSFIVALGFAFDKYIGYNYTISTEVELIQGDENKGYGLIWGAKDNKNAYAFLICKAGHYTIVKKENNVFEDIIAWTEHSEINGYGKDQLAIEQFKGELIFRINGYEVERIPSMPFWGNYVGFTISEKLDVEIDFLKIGWH